MVPQHAFHNLLSDGHRGIQTGHGILKDHGNVFAVDAAAQFPFFHFQDIHGVGGAVILQAGISYGPLLHLAVFIENSHGSFHGNGFAAAAFSYDRQGFPAVQINIHTADGMYRACRCTEGNRKVADFHRLFSDFLIHFLSPHTSLSFGSKASRSPSASILKQSISNARTMMGGTI